MSITKNRYTLGRTLQPSSDSDALVLTKHIWNSNGTKSLDDMLQDTVHLIRQSSSSVLNDGVSYPVKLKDKDDNILFPITYSKYVIRTGTTTIEDSLSKIEGEIVSGNSDTATNTANIKINADNIAVLMALHSTLSMTVENNSSTSTADKMKIRIVSVTPTGTTYPTPTFDTCTRQLTSYANGQETAVEIDVTKIILNSGYYDYEGVAESGKRVYTFHDSVSGKNGSITFRTAKVCYMWFGTSNTVNAIPSSDTSTNSPTKVQGSSNSDTNCVRQVLTTNQSTDSYIYIAVPKNWTVSKLIAHSNVADTVFLMSAVTSDNTEYNIFVSSETILNTNGNTIYVSAGTGSIN